MRITAPITDYIPQSILTTKGDLPVRGTVIPERLAAAAIGKVLTAQGAGAIPAYDSLFDLLTTKGDLLVRGTSAPERLVASDRYKHLKANNAGELPYWSRLSLGDTGFVSGNFTRNSSGTEEISGVGYQPTIIIFLGASTLNTINSWSIGIRATGIHYSLFHIEDNNTIAVDLTKEIIIYYVGANFIVGVLTNLDVDGFDVTFTLTGTASVDVIWLAFP